MRGARGAHGVKWSAPTGSVSGACNSSRNAGCSTTVQRNRSAVCSPARCVSGGSFRSVRTASCETVAPGHRGTRDHVVQRPAPGSFLERRIRTHDLYTAIIPTGKKLPRCVQRGSVWHAWFVPRLPTTSNEHVGCLSMDPTLYDRLVADRALGPGVRPRPVAIARDTVVPFDRSAAGTVTRQPILRRRTRNRSPPCWFCSPDALQERCERIRHPSNVLRVRYDEIPGSVGRVGHRTHAYEQTGLRRLTKNDRTLFKQYVKRKLCEIQREIDNASSVRTVRWLLSNSRKVRRSR